MLSYLKKRSRNLVVAEPPDDGSVATQKLDFLALGFPEYEFKYALVIDNVFNEADCQKLLSVTGATFDEDKWEVAQINGGGDMQFMDTTYRNGGRIMVDDQTTADWILEKIRPHLKEIELLNHARMHEHCARHGDVPKEGRAQLSRLNERLRFLRYEDGQFFKMHCDGLYFTPDRTQASYYTLQVYLNGSADTLKGGSTRFFSRKDRAVYNRKHKTEGPTIDVPPRTGRVLVFEQDGLLHSGMEVDKGVKVAMRTDFMYSLAPPAEPHEAAKEVLLSTRNQLDTS